MNNSNTTTAKETLLQFILFYRKKLELAISFLNKKSALHKDFHEIEKEGFLDEESTVRFEFHGIGCMIKTPQFKINVDFDEHGRCDGFSHWTLLAFFNDNKWLAEVYQIDPQLSSLKSLLIELKNEKHLFVKEYLLGGELYVLPEDYFSLNPVAWIQ
jgi:hypothetical protein